MSIAVDVPQPRTPAAVLRTLLRELEALDPIGVSKGELLAVLDDARASL